MTDAQFQRLTELLEQQTLILVAIAGALMPEQVVSDECQHPDENRVDLRTPATPDHWICNLCRYEHGVITN